MDGPATTYPATANTKVWFKHKLLGMLLKRKLKKMPQKDLSFFQSFPLGIFYDLGNACEKKLTGLTNHVTNDRVSDALDAMAMFFVVKEFTLDSTYLPKITLKDFVYTEDDLKDAFYAMFTYDSEYIQNPEESETPPPDPQAKDALKKMNRKRQQLLKELYPMVNKIRQKRTDKMDKITKRLFSNESDTVANEPE